MEWSRTVQKSVRLGHRTIVHGKSTAPNWDAFAHDLDAFWVRTCEAIREAYDGHELDWDCLNCELRLDSGKFVVYPAAASLDLSIARVHVLIIAPFAEGDWWAIPLDDEDEFNAAAVVMTENAERALFSAAASGAAAEQLRELARWNPFSLRLLDDEADKWIVVEPPPYSSK
ncbi:MAG: hypothetical protein JWO31_163 [Phycisphaerales bacterium]|nr:hypothetical protein [Phycisphaerales bacterium]